MCTHENCCSLVQSQFKFFLLLLCLCCYFIVTSTVADGYVAVSVVQESNKFPIYFMENKVFFCFGINFYIFQTYMLKNLRIYYLQNFACPIHPPVTV